MANAVFAYVEDALATLVSARAAKRVLEEALATANETPDTVSVVVMQALLTGYVRFELEQMLPRAGLQGQLEHVSARLPQIQDTKTPVEGEVAGEATGRPAAETKTDPTATSLQATPLQATPLRAGDNAIDSAIDTANTAEARAIADLADFTRAAATPVKEAANKPKQGKLPVAMWKDQFVVANKAARLKGITMADSTKTKQTLNEGQLESIVMRFAQVEHAKLIAAVRENGTIVTSRGAGVDLNSLARFGLMGLRLLERSGELRSYYLAHSQGQLFLFCFGKDTVIMLGSRDINVGTVFATLSSVKESL